MPPIASPALLIAGIIVFLIGIWLWRWSSRNAIDVKGAAISAGWQTVRSGKMPDVPDDIKNRYTALAGETSNTKRATKAGGMVVRHFMAKVFGLVGLAGILGGLGLAAAGLFWK